MKKYERGDCTSLTSLEACYSDPSCQWYSKKKKNGKKRKITFCRRRAGVLHNRHKYEGPLGKQLVM